YPVTLIVQDAQGCADTVMASVTVHPPPPPDTIAFTPSLTICAGGSVTLTAPAGPYTWLWSAAAGGATTQVITVTTAGTYSVTVTDANGCTMVPDSVTVVVNPLPSAIISGSPFICDAGCTTLSVATGFGYTYVWLDLTLSPLVPAQNGPTLQVCANNLLAGYAVMVTDPNGCTATSPVVTVSLAVSPAFTVTVMPDSCEGTPAILTVVPVQPNVVYAWSNGGTGPTITVLQAGVYNVVGTDTLTGCQGFGSQTIHPLPDLCIVPVGCYEICNPDTICGPDDLSAYQWNLNGVPIPGATNQCLIVMQSGTYTLTGATEFGCTLTSDSLMLTVIDCACDQLTVSAEPSTEDSCCWILSYDNQFGDLYGVVIHSDDTGFNFSGLSDSLQIFSIGTNTISLVNTQAGAPLPAGVLSNFLTACLTDVVNSPQQIIIDWYDFDYQIACSDTLIFDCPVEPDCLYLAGDTIYCDGADVVYTITVCNPVDNDFEVGYIVLLPSSPAGIVVTPPNVLVNPPMVPGECRDFSFVLSGPSLEGETFCFSLTAHDTVPGPIDTTHCCMLDTMYCIPIPDCLPCDDIGVEHVDSAASSEAFCCFNISLYNNYAVNFFDGIDLCLLAPATAMTINNPFGSGWSTASYTPTMIQLDVVPPLGNSLPLGVVNLPTICIQSGANPIQQVEIKWMLGDSVVCRDTVELFCDPDCGYLLNELVVCNDSGYWNYGGLIVNTSGFTMGEAHFVFTSPAGLGIYNQVVTFPGGLPDGGTYPFNLILDVPAMPGDTVCFTVALHQLNDNALHINCCTFHDCIVLPECAVEDPCVCDEAFILASQQGINCVILAAPPFTGTFSPAGILSNCDQVVWSSDDTPQTDTTYGNAPFTHTFPGPGNYKVCMQVHRDDVLTGNFCEFDRCKGVGFPSPNLWDPGAPTIDPNPSGGSFNVSLSRPRPGVVQFRVFNVYGQLIRDWGVQGAGGNNQIPVDLSALDKTVYLLEIRNEGRRWVRKVVIQ
ncbi:MAG: T9SS type A sorting domain-containing protein, partial [Saprospiraceae bacterium]